MDSVTHISHVNEVYVEVSKFPQANGLKMRLKRKIVCPQVYGDFCTCDISKLEITIADCVRGHCKNVDEHAFIVNGELVDEPHTKLAQDNDHIIIIKKCSRVRIDLLPQPTPNQGMITIINHFDEDTNLTNSALIAHYEE